MNAYSSLEDKIPAGEYRGVKKVVLAFSGGTDTSVILKLLTDVCKFEVVSFTADIGQQEYAGGLSMVKKRALELGAKKAIVLDLKNEFVDGYVAKAIAANCLYQGAYPNSTAIGRYLIARHLVNAAREEGAQAIVHGCTGKGNDQVRFDLTIAALQPDLRVIAPVRDWGLSRDEEYAYAKQAGINLPKKLESPYSIDANLWGKSSEAGAIEYPEEAVPDDVLSWVTKPELAPDEPAFAKIGFEKGVPTSLESGSEKTAGVLDTIIALNKLAGINGVGIIDHVEDRVIGLKSREFYECPAATVIIAAHKDLEKLVFTKEENQFKPVIDQKFAELSYSGLWNSPLMKQLISFLEESQKRVSGWVKVKLYKGSSLVIARSSPFALYDWKTATYDKTSDFNQKDSVAFIKLFGLSTITASKKQGVELT